MVYKFLKLDNRDGVGIITINRPPTNAINLELLEEMDKIFDQVSEDTGIKAVVITSANEKTFISGADVKSMDGTISQGRALSTDKIKVQDVFNKISYILKPVIAAINGHALGGGCEIALACDFRFMAKGGKIGLTEVLFGLLPGAGGTQRLVRLLGRAKATELLFRGLRLSAEEALEIGLVDKIFNPKDLLNEAVSYAKTFTRQAPMALKEIKRCINAAWEMGIKEGLGLESEAFRRLISTEDVKEGLKAFIEKREPTFKGR